MKDFIIYRPHRFHACFATLSFCISVFSSVTIGYYLPRVDCSIFIWLLVLFLSILFAKVLYDSANITVLFEEAGLRIVGGKHNDYRYIPWTALTNAYYVRSYKGHMFLMLSPEPLNKTQVKQYVNRSAYLSQLQIDSVIVIHIDATQDVSKVKEFVSKKISNSTD